MTGEEKFLFDLQGYIIVPGLLSDDELAELRRIADEKFAYTEDQKPNRRTSRVTLWAQPYVDLIDHPKLLPYLLELIGPHVRLDHDYCIFMQKNAPSMNLHGGYASEPDHWYRYHDGVIGNGLCVAVFALADCGPGDGGFACIPGSHKSNFFRDIPPDVRDWKQRADYVVQPVVKAGDVLIFTEALVHGTAPWTARHERQSLLYKYSPGHSAWAGRYYSEQEFEDAGLTLTDRQRVMLMPPSVGRRPAVS